MWPIWYDKDGGEFVRAVKLIFPYERYVESSAHYSLVEFLNAVFPWTSWSSCCPLEFLRKWKEIWLPVSDGNFDWKVKSGKDRDSLLCIHLLSISPSFIFYKNCNHSFHPPEPHIQLFIGIYHALTSSSSFFFFFCHCKTIFCHDI